MDERKLSLLAQSIRNDYEKFESLTDKEKDFVLRKLKKEINYSPRE